VCVCWGRGGRCGNCLGMHVPPAFPVPAAHVHTVDPVPQLAPGFRRPNPGDRGKACRLYGLSALERLRAGKCSSELIRGFHRLTPSGFRLFSPWHERHVWSLSVPMGRRKSCVCRVPACFAAPVLDATFLHVGGGTRRGAC